MFPMYNSGAVTTSPLEKVRENLQENISLNTRKGKHLILQEIILQLNRYILRLVPGCYFVLHLYCTVHICSAQYILLLQCATQWQTKKVIRN